MYGTPPNPFKSSSHQKLHPNRGKGSPPAPFSCPIFSPNTPLSLDCLFIFLMVFVMLNVRGSGAPPNPFKSSSHQNLHPNRRKGSPPPCFLSYLSSKHIVKFGLSFHISHGFCGVKCDSITLTILYFIAVSDFLGDWGWW